MKTSIPRATARLLERPDQLEACAVADVGQAGVAVATEVTLEDPAVRGAVEKRTPTLELVDAVRCLLGVQLGHAPVVEHLPAPHRVAEVHHPVVLGPHVSHGGRGTTFGHDRVRLAEKRLADQRGAKTAFLASMAARRPAPPAPMTITSKSWVSMSVIASEQLRIGEDTRSHEPHVEIGQRHEDQTGPGDLHVTGVQRGEVLPDAGANLDALRSGSRSRHKGGGNVARERVAPQQYRVHREHKGSDADPDPLAGLSEGDDRVDGGEIPLETHHFQR